MSYIGFGGFACSQTLKCLQLFANTLKEQLVDCTREYKQGYPCSLLKLIQMGTQGSTYERGLLGWFFGLVMLVQDIFVLPCRPSTKYFFLTVHYFTSFVPNAQRAGHSVVPGHLSLSVCLWTAPQWMYIIERKPTECLPMGGREQEQERVQIISMWLCLCVSWWKLEGRGRRGWGGIVTVNVW